MQCRFRAVKQDYGIHMQLERVHIPFVQICKFFRRLRRLKREIVKFTVEICEKGCMLLKAAVVLSRIHDLT